MNEESEVPLPTGWAVPQRRSTDAGPSVEETAFTAAVDTLVAEFRKLRRAVESDRRARRTVVWFGSLFSLLLLVTIVGGGVLFSRLSEVVFGNQDLIERIAPVTGPSAAAAARQNQTEAENRIILCVNNHADHRADVTVVLMPGCPDQP